MTGILQNTNAQIFFLTRSGLEFQPILGLKNSLCQMASSFCQSNKKMLVYIKFGNKIRDAISRKRHIEDINQRLFYVSAIIFAA